MVCSSVASDQRQPSQRGANFDDVQGAACLTQHEMRYLDVSRRIVGSAGRRSSALAALLSCIGGRPCGSAVTYRSSSSSFDECVELAMASISRRI